MHFLAIRLHKPLCIVTVRKLAARIDPVSAPPIQAKIRDDLIRRLFAVAISVGAASTLARMGWVDDGRSPNLDEVQQLFILAAAMTATVLSWDNYLVSISERPLGNFWRFAIDISLVFIYMFLLMTSRHHTWWLFIHGLTFLLYVIWDRLTIKDYVDQYYDANWQAGRRTAWRVYAGGLRDQVGVSRGPIITLGWAFYFWILYLLNKPGLDSRIFLTTAFAIAGLVYYRLDKKKRYSMIERVALIVFLLVLSYVSVKWGPRDELIWNEVTRYI